MKDLTKFHSLCYHNCYDYSHSLIFLGTDFSKGFLFVCFAFDPFRENNKEDAGVWGRSLGRQRCSYKTDCLMKLRSDKKENVTC